MYTRDSGVCVVLYTGDSGVGSILMNVVVPKLVSDERAFSLTKPQSITASGIVIHHYGGNC